MLKFICCVIASIIAAIVLCRFEIVDRSDIPQYIVNALALISLYKICDYEEKRGD